MAEGTLLDVYTGASEPHFDLSVERWVPVVYSGSDSETRVSLLTLVSDAHRLDLSFADPMAEHAMLRFLLAGSHLSFAAPGAEQAWRATAQGGPLPVLEVMEGLRRVAGSFWLFDPEKPFFQDPGLLGALSSSQSLKPARALFPYVPEGSNPSWFNRDAAAPGPEDLAVGLLIRHYFALPGNETPNLVLGGKRSEGGSAQMSHRGRSFIWHASGTLALTLAANMISDWAASAGSSCAFREQPGAVADRLGDPIYLYSSSGASSLLVQAPGGDVLLARTPALLTGAGAKLLSEASRMNDPHALRTPPRSAAAGQFSHLIFSPDAHQFANMQKMFDYSGGLGVAELVGVSLLKRHTRMFSGVPSAIRILNVAGAGSATAAVISSASASTADPTSLRMIEAQGMHAEAIASLMSRVGGSSASARSHVTYRVVSALRASGLRDAVRQKVDLALWGELEGLVESVVDRVAGAPEHLALQASLLSDAEVKMFVAAGLRVYDDLCGSPSRLRDTSEIHRNRIGLTRSLRGVACRT